jgi:AraC-like DNA-binding protein
MGLASGWSVEAARGAWGWRCAAPGAPALETRNLGDVTLLRLSAPPDSLAPDSLANASPHAFTPPRGCVVLVALTRGGCGFTAADGRPRRLRRKEVLLALGGSVLTLAPDAGSRLIGLAAPAHLIAPRLVSAERLRAGALKNHAGPVAALLYDLVTRLAGGEPGAPGAAALADAIGGLLSATLEGCESAAPAGRGAAGQTRLQQIGRHLRRHFADPDLCASDVAAAVGVSRRYLHRLYAEDGRSFRDELVGLRIQACLDAFMDEDQVEKTIAEIAYSAGYADISQFNRHFRRLQGQTPSASRRAALDRRARDEPANANARPRVLEKVR